MLSKPSKPKGPLEVSDVTAEGCKLKWDKPEDDGGEPVDHYVIERMDVDTGRWVPCGTSKTMLVLNKLQRSDAGTYTVIAKNDSGTDQVDVELQVYIKQFYT